MLQGKIKENLLRIGDVLRNKLLVWHKIFLKKSYDYLDNQKKNLLLKLQFNAFYYPALNKSALHH